MLGSRLMVTGFNWALVSSKQRHIMLKRVRVVAMNRSRVQMANEARREEPYGRVKAVFVET